MTIRLLWVYFAAAFAVLLAVGTGLIPNWGEWYSPSVEHRWQTDAFFEGRLALSESPAQVPHDHVWAEGGVHQVWGLGVPTWRLLFEATARLFGETMFPDRIALLAAFAVFAYLIFAIFTGSPSTASISEWVGRMKAHPEEIIVVVGLIAFPPLVTLLNGPFKVYEEVVAYGYLYSVGLFAGLMAFRWRPCVRYFVPLCLAGGLAGFFRPPMLAYGFATVVLAFLILRKSREDADDGRGGGRRGEWGWLIGGLALFGAGVGLLFLTNSLRFGSGFEFGHKLNLSGLDLMYASRFGAPYHSESILAAAKELFGSTFLVRDLNGWAVYNEDVVPLQSATPRWRHFYHTTFDVSFLVLLAIAWIAGISKAAAGIFRKKGVVWNESTLAVVWSLAGVLPIAVFYLDFHAMSSRYILDFAPGIAVALAGAVYVIRDIAVKRHAWKPRLQMFVATGFAAWWGVQVFSGGHYFPQTPVLTRDAVFSELPGNPEAASLPAEYALEGPVPLGTGFGQNGRGWNRQTGATDALVVLFVSDPKHLILHVASAEGEALSDEDFASIRARIGLEELQLESVEPLPEGRRLVFSGPEKSRYRYGVQVVFLAFVPVDSFLKEDSAFKLKRVAWQSVE